MKIKYLIVLLTLMSLLTIVPQLVYAVENDFAVELKVLKEVVSPTEPIYIGFRVRNTGDNELPLFYEDPPGYIRPCIGGRFYLESVDNDSIEVDTVGPIGPPDSSDTIRPHSDVILEMMDWRGKLGFFERPLEPGLYRVRFGVSWHGISENLEAEAYFTVEEVQKVKPILMLPKVGEIHR